MKWVTSEELDRLAESNLGQQVLPELVRRLIRASSPRVQDIRFPGGESIFSPGWDGELLAVGAPPHVPEGGSVWELSKQSQVGAKAFSDFLKRSGSGAPPMSIPLQRSEITYVAVTMRRWRGGKDTSLGAFLHKARERKIWKDVRAIDADILDQWIDECPSVGLWLARDVLNKHTAGLHSFGDFWDSYAGETSPELRPALLTSDRETELASIERWLSSRQSGVLLADSPKEAAAFAIAAVLLRNPGDPLRDDCLAKGIVATSLEAVEHFRGEAGGLCLILLGEAIQREAALRRAGHTVIVAWGNTLLTNESDNQVRLGRASRQAFADQLVEMGLSQGDAQAASQRCSASVTVFRRIHSQTGVLKPAWLTPVALARLLGPFIVGAWDVSMSADRELVAKAAGLTEHEVGLIAAEFQEQDDPAVFRTGSITSLNAPADVITSAVRASVITAITLVRLRDCAVTVLSEKDPALDLPLKEQMFAGLYGKQRKYSDWLRAGISEVLRLLAVRDDLDFPQGKAAYFQGLVDGLNLADGYEAWASLSDRLPTLFEAAPVPFLSALEEILSERGEILAALFEGADESLGGRHHYAGLLRALEVLAWSKTLVERASLCLAALADVAGGHRYGARPIESLTEIFLPWLPHTSAATSKRRSIVQLICRRHPAMGWGLVERLLPDATNSSSGTARPMWRDFGPLPMHPSEEERMGDYLFYLRLGEELASRTPSRWISLVKASALCGEDVFEQCLERMRGALLSEVDDALHEDVWLRLTALVERHTKFTDAHWAYPAEIVRRLEVEAAAYAPNDPVSVARQTYDADGVWQAGGIDEARPERLEKLGPVIASGISELMRLASIAKFPGVIGADLAELLSADEAADVVIASTGEGDSAAYMGAVLLRHGRQAYGEGWKSKLLERVKIETADGGQRARLLLAMPDSLALFELVESLGVQTSREYWLARGIFVAQDDPHILNFAISKFMYVGRFVDLIAVVGHAAKSLETGILMGVLDGAVQALLTDHGQGSHLHSHWLSECLSELARREDVDLRALANLECAFLPAFLSQLDVRHLAIHKVMATDPSVFVEFLCALYRAEGEAPDEVDKEKRAVATLAYRVLDSWRSLDWRNADGSLDVRETEDWISAVLELADREGRSGVARSEIGKLLAYAEVDQVDGIWPEQGVRIVLEEFPDERIVNSIVMEIFNKRGAHWRGRGGDQERELAAEAEFASSQLRELWPQASLIQKLSAEDWLRHARWADQREEEDKLRAEF